ncbi:MAG: beta-lactamase family protein [Pirellulales bacterium]|nr:beta-lactamase family protein [Pirellulales bacterium]
MRWILILAALLAFPAFLIAEDEISITGREVAELQSFDRRIEEFMQKYELPGATAAVAKDGRLVYERGFGWADRKNEIPMPPDALLRIASVSKPITSAAFLRLVELGRLKLDEPILPYLKKFGADEEQNLDPRWKNITLEQLLRHTAGFDRGKSFDPMFIPQLPKPPLDQAGVIRHMLGRPLDYDPGARYVYANFDYCMIGRVIEAAAGKNYEEAVRELVLQPAGITRMKLGKTRLADRAEGEAIYHVRKGDRRFRSVFPGEKERVEEPYGQFYLEALDAHGGWLATASDLVRFASALDGRRPPRLLKPESIAKIESLSDPPIFMNKDKERHYGLGWVIVAEPGRKYWYHDGLLAGTRTMLIRSSDGLAMAALFNGQSTGKGNFYRDLDRMLWKAADEVKSWPKGDIWPQEK